MTKFFAFLTSVLFLAAAGTASAADESRRNERLGVGSGAVIGALAGGPVGLIIGASVGGYTGSNVTSVKHVDRLSDELEIANAAISRLESDLDETVVRVAEMTREQSRQSLEQSLADGLSLTVMYGTGDSDLSDDSRQLLTELALLLKSMPGLAVQLDGYADQRGTVEFNDQLSVARVEGVMELLMTEGIAKRRIAAHGHGARQTHATNGDMDAYALERRVNIKLVLKDRVGAVAQSN